VSRGGKDLGTLRPAMNQYERQREPIGTPAVRTSLKEDLYLSVMNIDTQAGTLGLLAMVNPMVGCLWLATGVMALGGLMALVPSRRRTAVALPAGVRADLTAEPTR
jgi:cytochrome c-type biogenesis protein CcmF